MLQVITVNQVVDILAKVQKNNDWKAVLRQVLPERKIVGQQSIAADTTAAAAQAEHTKEQPTPVVPHTVKQVDSQQASSAEVAVVQRSRSLEHTETEMTVEAPTE